MSSPATVTNSSKTMSPSPWGKAALSASPPCSLQDVMSEQLAVEIESQQLSEAEPMSTKMDTKLELSQLDQNSQGAACEPTNAMSDAELAAKLAAEEEAYDPSDEIIARSLQKDYDREYDEMIDRAQKKCNGSNKVSLSFENYKRLHKNENDDEDDDEDDDFYNEPPPEFPSATKWDTPAPTIGGKGYSGQGKNIVTKHDKVICGRRNAERLMELPPGVDIGDGEGMDMQLPNSVYNSLKTHSLGENKKSMKIHEKKDHSTAIKAVDENTRILLFKMINNGSLSSIDGVVSEGKEAMIFKATGGVKGEVELPQHVILKIYKTTMNEFKTRARYVYGDHQLSKDLFKKQNPRKVIRIWAEKEFLNLKRMLRRGIPCPQAIYLKKNILAMSCIGGDHPAPKLKEVKFSTEDLQDAYEQTIDLMKRMYRDCCLIHADLSEFNLLWHEEKVWVIDVSQSVEQQNKNSGDFLLRDCQNICRFFKQSGAHGVALPEELYRDITNCDLEGEGKVFASQMKKYEKDDYAFDFFFENQKKASSDDDEDDDDDADEMGEEVPKTEEKEGTSEEQCSSVNNSMKKVVIKLEDDSYDK